jgi:hypothetical protein
MARSVGGRTTVSTSRLRNLQQFLAGRVAVADDALRGRHQAQQARELFAPRVQVQPGCRPQGRSLTACHVAFHVEQGGTQGLGGFARLCQLQPARPAWRAAEKVVSISAAPKNDARHGSKATITAACLRHSRLTPRHRTPGAGGGRARRRGCSHGAGPGTVIATPRGAPQHEEAGAQRKAFGGAALTVTVLSPVVIDTGSPAGRARPAPAAATTARSRSGPTDFECRAPAPSDRPSCTNWPGADRSPADHLDALS